MSGAVVRRERPDVVVTDIRMPPTFTDEGLRAAIELRADNPGLSILVLSQHTDTASLAELLATGDAGVGYLLKDRVANGERFVAAVSEVAAGGTVIDQEIVRRLLARQRISEVMVAKHIGAIFGKLGLHAEESGHRRVRAVLAYLRGLSGVD